MSAQESLLPGEEPEPDWSEVEAGEAYLSEDRVYRYALSRVWNARRPMGLIIGLNPSTADEQALDQTLRRCIRFAHREGWGGFWMGNLFAVRETKPTDMKRHPAPIGEPMYPIDPEIPPRNVNDRWLLDLARWCNPRIICAWGAHGTHMDRGRQVQRLLDGHRAQCFGFTGNGQPRHPLMLHRDTELVPFVLDRNV